MTIMYMKLKLKTTLMALNDNHRKEILSTRQNPFNAAMVVRTFI